jgi:hypothetical protein
MSLQGSIPIFAKMPIFGFLIILSVWMGNANYEGLPSKKQGKYCKTAFQWHTTAFLIYLVLMKEGSYEQKNCGY